MITKYITCLLYAICAKPEKKDDYNTTNHTGVNGPTGPITQKAYGPFTPQVNFMLFASNITYSMPFTAIVSLYPSKATLKHLPSVQHSIIFNATGHIS